MKFKFKSGNKSFNIKPYNTEKEKEILLLKDLYDENSENLMDIILEIFELPNNIIESLTLKEKIALLWKYRSVSIGEEISIKYKCTSCKKPNEAQIDITNLITSNKVDDDRIIYCEKELTEDNIQDFVNVDIDELDIDDYEELYEKIKKASINFNFKKTIKCAHCNNDNYINIGNSEFVIDFLSDDSITSLYQTYNNLIYFGKYSKIDIDSMLPFERVIFIGLLNKTREDISNGK